MNKDKKKYYAHFNRRKKRITIPTATFVKPGKSINVKLTTAK